MSQKKKVRSAKMSTEGGFRSILNTIVILGVPGPVEALVDFPLIYTKNALQTGRPLPPVFRPNPKWGGAPGLRNIKEYYRGAGVTAVGGFFSNFLQLWVNNYLKTKLGVINPLTGITYEGKEGQGLLCAAASGLAMATAWTPVELSQVTQGYQRCSLLQAARRLYSRAGLRAFYTGFVATATRDMLYGGLIFGLHPYIDKLYAGNSYTTRMKKKHPLFMTALAGFTSGAIVGALTIPVDNYRTVIQASGLNKRPLTIRQAIGNIVRGQVFYNPDTGLFTSELEVMLPSGQKEIFRSPTGTRALLRGGFWRIARIGMCGFIILYVREMMRKVMIKDLR